MVGRTPAAEVGKVRIQGANGGADLDYVSSWKPVIAA